MILIVGSNKKSTAVYAEQHNLHFTIVCGLIKLLVK